MGFWTKFCKESKIWAAVSYEKTVLSQERVKLITFPTTGNPLDPTITLFWVPPRVNTHFSECSIISVIWSTPSDLEIIILFVWMWKAVNEKNSKYIKKRNKGSTRQSYHPGMLWKQDLPRFPIIWNRENEYFQVREGKKKWREGNHLLELLCW